MRPGSALLPLLFAGCFEPDDTGLDTGMAPFECTLGSLDADDAFRPYAATGTAELVLGFQGFLFVQARVLARDGPPVVEAVASITVEGEEPAGSTQPGVHLEPVDGGQLSDGILVFLPSSSVSAWEDRPATLAVRLQGEGQACVATADVVLVDEDPCIHTDDEPICPDTGDSG